MRQATPEPRETPAAAYEALAVLQPASGETLWGTGGTVEVAIALSPNLQPSHRLALYLDGAHAAFGNRATGFVIDAVSRGEHTIQVAVQDEAGTELLRSAPVTFHVQQTSIHYPQNPGRAR